MNYQISELGQLTIDDRTIDPGNPVEQAEQRDYILLVRPFSDLLYDKAHEETGLRTGRFGNVIGVDSDGEVAWRADLPSDEPTDYYLRVASWEPFLVNSFSSYLCEIDPRTGKIFSEKFMK